MTPNLSNIALNIYRDYPGRTITMAQLFGHVYDANNDSRTNQENPNSRYYMPYTVAVTTH